MKTPSNLRCAILFLLTLITLTAGEWRPLFNGRDLTGWETYLGKPHASVTVPGLKRDEKGVYLEAIGENRDPLNNFLVNEIDGKPAIHVSGQGFGYLVTQEKFANYHLKLQFKWGEKKWAPREQAVRDSGLLYHVHGAPAASSGVWPASVELQIQERDCGDLYAIVTRLTVPARSFVTAENKTLYQYDPNAAPVEFKQERPIGNRCIRLADFEKTPGEWNTLELICVGGDSIHIVNGQVVMRLHDARQVGEGGVWRPLTEGRIALQTEGAEVYFREISIKSITVVPPEFAE